MDKQGLRIDVFLYAMWAEASCIKNTDLKGVRGILAKSGLLLVILENWWNPTTSASSRNAKPEGARAVIEQFIGKILTEKLDDELEAAQDIFKSTAFDNEDISKETLLSINILDMARQLKLCAPLSCQVLSRMGTPKNQSETSNDLDVVCLDLATCSAFVQGNSAGCDLYNVNNVLFAQPASWPPPKTDVDIFQICRPICKGV